MIDPLIVATVEYGGILSVMCIGLTVTYQTTKVPNFAYADVVVVGMTAAYFSYVLLGLASSYLTLPFSMLVAGAFAVLMYILVMKPLIKRGSSILNLMIASLAVDILFTGVEADISEIGIVPFSRAFTHAGIPVLVEAPPLPDFNFLIRNGIQIVHTCPLASAGSCIPGIFVISPVLLAATTGTMYLLLKRSRFGIAMRAAIENPSLARVVGINVDRVYTVSWFIAGALGGLAGSLYAIGDGMSLGVQNTLILDIFAGSVLGGLSSIYGAVIGGLLVAIGENYVITVLAKSVNSQLLVLQVGGVSMIILIITLLVAPKGLVAVNWRRLVSRRS